MKSKISSIFKIFKEFVNNSKGFSLKVAVAKVVVLLPIISWSKRKKFYEKTILGYLSKEMSGVIDNTIAEYSEDSCEECLNKRIWVMWWQGEESMPPIVKACYEQLISVAHNCEVVFLTEKNLNKYVTIPQNIHEKFISGKIGFAHFSDIVRVALLKQCGGAWFDATLYVSKISNDIFENMFYTINAEGIFLDFIGRGAWQTYFLSTNKTNTLFFDCLLKMFEEYWEKHNVAIDYLFFDYFIEILYNNVKPIRDLIGNAYKNRHFYDLNLAINDEYSEECFKKMLMDSPIQKLSYRKELVAFTEAGKITNYGYIIKEKSNEFINNTYESDAKNSKSYCELV